ncbi:hypothetical protein [Apilactobacillus ozensis]|uniref:hypothetical protein n=1 Tax=Apilactobacillus ozensis TaxID=866801 RepID=UPI000704F193|nr:hypothetical protein [Apilactobacillus ozensis]MCK8607739.1 hypothetical protein [Apilactobacillus ozensis]
MNNRMFFKEIFLNIILVVFPAIFIISSIGNLPHSRPLYLVGILLLGMISLMMSPIYFYYWYSHRQKQSLLYRKILAIVYLMVLIFCLMNIV